jgi:arylsulfatase A-like enzyme
MKFLFCAFPAIAIIAFGCKGHQAGGSGERPNIIFIMADDHATQALSCYGSRFIQSKNIDELAAEGMLFNRAFVTNSLCAPSRAVILTGKHSHLNGVPDNHARFDSSQVTFPKILQKSGYQTAMIGKWHLKSQPTGFDYWNVLPGQGDYYNPRFINNGSDTTYHGYVTDIVTDLSLEWLTNRRKGEPFLLMVHHKAPHRNWMPDFKHLNVYDDVEFPMPASFHDDYSGREHLHEQKLTVAHHMDMVYDLKIPCDSCPLDEVNRWARDEYRKQLKAMDPGQVSAWEKGYKQEIHHYETSSFKGDELIDWKYQRYLQDYLRCILSVDENVGRIMDYLDQHGLAENTVVVYTSDQGFFLGEHGLFDKRYIYEESLRTPLVIRYPEGIEPGLICHELVQNLDIAPTILEMAGADVPAEMQGRSLQALFTSPVDGNWRDAVYYQFYESGWGVPQHCGIRTKTHKLIHFLSEPENWELYDLENDPHEMVNLYDEPASEGLIRDLKNDLKELQKLYRVPE